MLLGYLLQDYRDFGIRIPVKIKLAKEISSILITGKSGSGKTLSTLWYLWNMLNDFESVVYVSDYKAEEAYELLQGSKSYSSDGAVKMIENYYELYSEIRKSKIRLNTHYTLLIEEWAGLLTYSETISKKLKSELQAKVGELLMVSRSINLGVILCTQRADASLFTSSATREQFQATLTFGKCSAEQFKMMGYSELDENPTDIYRAGQALLRVDGYSIKEIIVPLIQNSDTMLKGIRYYLDLQPDIETLIRSPDLWK